MVLSANKPGYLVLTLFLLHEQMTIDDTVEGQRKKTQKLASDSQIASFRASHVRSSPYLFYRVVIYCSGCCKFCFLLSRLIDPTTVQKYSLKLNFAFAILFFASYKNSISGT